MTIDNELDRHWKKLVEMDPPDSPHRSEWPKWYYKDERALKNRVIQLLSPSFELREEVTGKFPPTGKRNRVDFLARVTCPVLIELGFPTKWFGIEAKHFPYSKHQIETGHPHYGTNIGKAGKLMHQCFQYRYSVYKVDGVEIMPEFMLYVVPVPNSRVMHEMRVMGTSSNVGELRIHPEKDGVRMYFGFEWFAIVNHPVHGTEVRPLMTPKVRAASR